MEVDAPPPPPRPTGSRIGPEDYVDEAALPRIFELIEESSHRDAEKAAGWKRKAELQESSSMPSPAMTSSRPPPPLGKLG
jgi:hypothetical protein